MNKKGKCSWRTFFLVNVINSMSWKSNLNGKLMGLQLCVYMCVCGFSFVDSFFVVNFPSLYKFLFLRRSTERDREKNRTNKMTREWKREKKKVRELLMIFFLSFYCSLYGIFFIFISFSEFHFFCPSNYIMFFFFIFFSFLFFGYMIDYLEIRCWI